MDPNIKCRVEGITENDCISRIYWTDNKNPLRTLNIRGKNLEDLNPDELDITPKCDHSQIVLKMLYLEVYLLVCINIAINT